MLQDELKGKKDDLAKQRALPEIRKKRKVSGLWKEGQVTQDNYKDFVRLHRVKIRKVKVQLGLNLATDMKDNKKCFHKHTNNKRRTK